MTTQKMAGRTMSMTAGSTPSRAALATRSLITADRLRKQGNAAGYREALGNHFATFISPSASCPVR